MFAECIEIPKISNSRKTSNGFMDLDFQLWTFFFFIFFNLFFFKGRILCVFEIFSYFIFYILVAASSLSPK